MWELGEQALDELLETLEKAAEAKDLSPVPTGVRPEVAELLGDHAEGVEQVVFKGYARGVSRVARFDVGTVVAVPVVTPSSRRRRTLSGRLREVDFKDHTAELYDATGRMTRVRFSAEQESDLEFGANKTVTLTGDYEEPSTGGRPTIEIETLHAEVIDGGSFWDRAQLQRLAAASAVPRLELGDTVAPVDFWPDDLDPQDFVALIDDNGTSSDESL